MPNLRRHSALLALTAAGLLWGLTVPLSKLVLEWLDGGTLTAVRFALAAPVLALIARRHLRAAFTPRILAAGAIGYGVVIVLQNAGIERTSVSHAALIVGATPALVALTAAATGRGRSGTTAWMGFALALAGVAIVAGGGGGASTLGGDAIVLLSVTISATFVVIQPSLLRGRDPFAVTAVQMIGGGVAALPSALAEGVPQAPVGSTPVLALAALAFAGTIGPFALFAYGQARVQPQLAGAFLNLEPLVGTAAGALAFGDPFGPAQLAGAVVILAGIVLSTGEGSRTRTRRAPAAAQPVAAVTVEACTDSSRSTWPGRRRPSVAVVAEVGAASRT
ncbi:MAG TPA: DMT family transporter [Solirubrobacter sp.]|nr:DMT family transporter [Solirubrobacter sp.]